MYIMEKRVIVKKVILGIGGTVIYYFITVLVLFVLTAMFNDSFENIWLSAMPVTVIAELLLLGFYMWQKRKKQ